jgi:hypothetical protein
LHIRLFYVGNNRHPTVININVLDTNVLLPAVTKPPKNFDLGRIGSEQPSRSRAKRRHSLLTPMGTVTLPNRARNKSAGMLGSRRIDDVAPRLHRRGPEGSVRFCGGEMALDVESVVSGCVG